MTTAAIMLQGARTLKDKYQRVNIRHDVDISAGFYL